jgi:hypothetical protein
MQISRGVRAAAALGTLTAVALLTACSSGGNDTPGSTTTPATGAASTAPSTSTSSSSSSSSTSSGPTASASTVAGTGTAAEKAALAKLLLVPSDLPAGWTASAAQASTDDGAAQARFAKCVGIRNTHADKVAEADSQEFSKSSASVSSSATSYSSAADVTADAQAFQDGAKATSCMTTMLRSEMTGQLPGGATLDDLNLKVLPGTNGGPANVIAKITGTIKVTSSGQHFTVYLDSTYLAGTKIEAEVDFESFSAPVDSALQAKLVKAVAQRVANA